MMTRAWILVKQSGERTATGYRPQPGQLRPPAELVRQVAQSLVDQGDDLAIAPLQALQRGIQAEAGQALTDLLALADQQRAALEQPAELDLAR